MTSKRFSRNRTPNLLFLSPVYPSNGGSGLAMRALAVLRALQNHYRVHLLVIDPWSPGKHSEAAVPKGIEFVEVPFGLFGRCSGLNEAPTGRRIAPYEWPLLTTGQDRFLKRLGKDLCFDKVHVFRLYMAPFATPFLGDIPCQLDLDEIESEVRLRHAEISTHAGQLTAAHAHRISVQFYQSAERAWLDKFDEIFVSSQLTAKVLGRICQGVPIRVLPNVVEIPEKLPPSSQNNIFTLVFIGNMGYFPNRDAVYFLANEIVPALRRDLEKSFVIELVGSGELPTHQIRALPPEISWLGYAPDLVPVYQRSHVVVAPIRSAGGTRIKILEAFAHARPVVTTAIGAEGLPVIADTHCLLADTAKSFSLACARLQADETLRNRLAKNAYSLVCEKFTKKTLEEIIVDCYKTTKLRRT